MLYCDPALPVRMLFVNRNTLKSCAKPRGSHKTEQIKSDILGHIRAYYIVFDHPFLNYDLIWYILPPGGEIHKYINIILASGRANSV